MKIKTKKAPIVWCVKDPTGYLLSSSVSNIKKDSIYKIAGAGDWSNWRRYGWKCVKVQITEIKTNK